MNEEDLNLLHDRRIRFRVGTATVLGAAVFSLVISAAASTLPPWVVCSSISLVGGLCYLSGCVIGSSVATERWILLSREKEKTK